MFVKPRRSSLPNLKGTSFVIRMIFQFNASAPVSVFSSDRQTAHAEMLLVSWQKINLSIYMHYFSVQRRPTDVCVRVCTFNVCRMNGTITSALCCRWQLPFVSSVSPYIVIISALRQITFCVSVCCAIEWPDRFPDVKLRYLQCFWNVTPYALACP